MKRFTLITAVFAMMFFTMPQNAGIESQNTAKVYWMITVNVPLGQLSAYHAFAQNELRPAQEKYGYKFIGSWQTIVGDIEQAISICEFENMEAYNAARLKFVGSEDWKKLSPSFTKYVKSVETRFLRALPYSKIK